MNDKQRYVVIGAVVALILPITLTGCASTPPQLERGRDAYKSGNYTTAWHEWQACANQGEPVCMAALGAGFEERRFPAADPMLEAIRWYTLSARYGFGGAKHRLAVLGQPIPPADLAPAPVAIDSRALEGLGEALGQALRRGTR